MPDHNDSRAWRELTASEAEYVRRWYTAEPRCCPAALRIVDHDQAELDADRRRAREYPIALARLSLARRRAP